MMLVLMDNEAEGVEDVAGGGPWPLPLECASQWAEGVPKTAANSYCLGLASAYGVISAIHDPRSADGGWRDRRISKYR